ncbi:hypothetical protein [Lentzea terrae]|uniref:hypothetical protein n=1 Tax=Lentzea terrae TaxID=2200761 RepID=UPI001300593B|nr:hypothetical protein [Lentzea terrae]
MLDPTQKIVKTRNQRAPNGVEPTPEAATICTSHRAVRRGTCNHGNILIAGLKITFTLFIDAPTNFDPSFRR